MRLEDFATRFDELVEAGKNVRRYSSAGLRRYAQIEDLIPFRARGLSLLQNVFGLDHPYCKGFNENTPQPCEEEQLDGAIGILASAAQDIKNGWMSTLKHLVAAEFFADFMEMAEHLLANGYKDPAAVMIGSVLEEHLRQLCKVKGVDTEQLKANGDKAAKRADTMNADLVKAGAYTATQGKQITAWQGLRNDAAHGHYDKYSIEQTKLMYDGVLNFLTRIVIS